MISEEELETAMRRIEQCLDDFDKVGWFYGMGSLSVAERPFISSTRFRARLIARKVTRIYSTTNCVGVPSKFAETTNVMMDDDASILLPNVVNVVLVACLIRKTVHGCETPRRDDVYEYRSHPKKMPCTRTCSSLTLATRRSMGRSNEE